MNTSYAQQMAQNFTELTQLTLEWGLGEPPPTSGSTQKWLADAVSSSYMDPLQYVLSNISELFSPAYTNDPALNIRYDAVNAALAEYCQLHLLTSGVLASCNEPPAPPPPPAPVGYGAVGCPVNGNGGPECHNTFSAVTNGMNNVQAQIVALDYCPTCEIQASFSNGACFSLAIANGNNWFALTWNWWNLTQADQAAVSDCQSHSGKSCSVVSNGCTYPPPANALWGAIACTSHCGSYAATNQGFPDRIEAHKVAMEQVPGSWVAIDFNQCGAVVRSDNGYASSAGDTPQDATNSAMAACHTEGWSNCQPLTYSCVSPTLDYAPKLLSPASPSFSSSK